MVAVISGNTLGLVNSSLGSLGSAGGSATPDGFVNAGGATAGSVYVNTVTGNLIIQNMDETLAGLGADFSFLRTYNSRGLLNDANADNWRWNAERRVTLSGTANTAGSTVTRISGDGSSTVFEWDAAWNDGAGAYVSTEGSGAHDVIELVAGEWRYTEGSTQLNEYYNETTGLLDRFVDKAGNIISYGYDTESRISSITDQGSGQRFEFSYTDATGSRLENIYTRESATDDLIRQVHYEYNSTSGLLEAVNVDLSPDSSNVYNTASSIRTVYGYETINGQTVVNSITQYSGGTNAYNLSEIDYDVINGEVRVTEVSDSNGTTSFAYNGNETTVTVTGGPQTVYVSDSEGRLTESRKILSPTESESTFYNYNTNGDVVEVVDAAGHAVRYYYDERGNRLLEIDAAGNYIKRTWSEDNQLLTESTYQHASLLPQPAVQITVGGLPTIPGDLGEAFTTHFIYSEDNLLRFTVSPEGRVTENQYDAYGNLTEVLTYDVGDESLELVYAQQEISAALDFSSLSPVSFGPSQDGGASGTDTTVVQILDSGATISVSGNSWKALALPTTINANTILEFDFKTSNEGELHGIGFTNNVSTSDGTGETFGLTGSEFYGAWFNNFGNYSGNGEYQHYVIRLGEFLSGDHSHMTFIADDDGSANSESVFSNVKIYDEARPTPEHALNLNYHTVQSYGTDLNQDVSQTYNVTENGYAIELLGNTWKAVDFPYTITENTWLSFDFESAEEGELHAIGFSNSAAAQDDNATFLVHGNDNFASWFDDYKNYAGTGPQHFEIPVGEFLSGNYQYLTFISDHDIGATAESIFRNIELHERDPSAISPPDKGDALDFNNLTISSYAGFQDATNSATVVNGGSGIQLTQNTWKAIALPEPILLTPDTVLEFEFSSSVEGEIHGIGLTNSLGFDFLDGSFGLHGVETHGGWNNTYNTYDGSGAPQVFKIRVGEHLSGSYQYLVFVSDDDANAASESTFNNIRIYEDVPASELLTTEAEPTVNNVAQWLVDIQADVVSLNEFQYDARGNLERSTSYANVDEFGEGVLNEAAVINEYVYDQHGQLLNEITVRGINRDQDTTVASYVYDGAGRITLKTGASGTVTTAYGGESHEKVVTHVETGLATTSVYDDRGKLISITQDDSENLARSTSYAYDEAGRLRMVQDALGNRSWNFYDEAGRVSFTVDKTGGVTAFVYNENGQLESETRYANPITDTSTWYNPGIAWRDGSFSIDTLVEGTTFTLNSAEDRSTLYEYDIVGRLESQYEIIGAQTTNTYDGTSRLVQSATGDRITRFFYDDDGLLIGSINAEGEIARNVYDSVGRLIQSVRYEQKVDPQNIEHFSELLLQVSGSDTLSSHYFYDAMGRQIGMVNEQGFLSETAFNAALNQRLDTQYMTAVTISAGDTLASLRAVAGEAQTTTIQFDGFGRILSTEDVAGTVSRNYYDEAGRLFRSVSAEATIDERSAMTHYNAYGEVMGVVSGVGAVGLTHTSNQSELITAITDYGMEYTYDALGRRTSMTGPEGQATHYYYDAMGRLQYTLQATEIGVYSVSETHYNRFGEVANVTRYAEQLNLVTPPAILMQTELDTITNLASDQDEFIVNEYTKRGQLEVATSGRTDTRQTHFDYNAFGEQTDRYDAWGTAAQVRTNHVYDKLGRRTDTYRDADGGFNIHTSMSYDGFGRIEYVTDANGNTAQTLYLDQGRTVASVSPLGYVNRSTFDAYGRELQIVDALGNATSYSYNDVNRSFTLTTPQGLSITTELNAQGETWKVTDAKNLVTEYQYTKDGNLDTVTVDGVLITDNDYDNSGRLEFEIDGDGRKVQYLYDDANRLLMKVVDGEPGGQAIWTAYGFDGVGRKLVVADANTVTFYKYNEHGQIEQIVVDPEGEAISTLYEYDERGNRTFIHRGKADSDPEANFEHIETLETTQTIYDNLDRVTQTVVNPGGLHLVTQYFYDDNGNLTRQIEPKGFGTNNYSTWFVYDAENRLTHEINAMGEVTEYSYDARNQVFSERRYASAITLNTAWLNDNVHTSVPGLVQSNLDHVSYRVYDQDGRERFALTAVEDTSWVITETRYDNGNNIKETRRYDQYFAQSEIDALVSHNRIEELAVLELLVEAGYLTEVTVDGDITATTSGDPVVVPDLIEPGPLTPVLDPNRNESGGTASSADPLNITFTNSTDVGSVQTAGSLSYVVATDTYTLNGSGSGIGGGTDDMHFAYETVQGDFDAKVRLVSFTNGSQWALAGLMLRESLDPQSFSVGAFIDADQNFRSGERDGAASHFPMTSGGKYGYGDWIRLTREGDTFRVYGSGDGENWNLIETYEVEMTSQTVYLGLGVSSNNNSVLAEAVFDNFSVVDAVMPDPSPVSDVVGVAEEQSITDNVLGSQTHVGGVKVVGDASYDNTTGTYTLHGSGKGIGGGSDEMHFTYAALQGDFDAKVRVVSFTNGAQWARAGLMLRDSLHGQSINVGAFISESEGFASGARYTKGASQNLSAGGSYGNGDWLRLTREGDTFRVYASGDGENWNLIETYEVEFTSQTVYLGLAVASNNDGVLAEAVFDNFSVVDTAVTASSAVTAVPGVTEQQTIADNVFGKQTPVGGVAVVGEADYDPLTETFTITGSGRGIGGGSDEFHYTYEAIQGDFDAKVRLVSFINGSDYARAGLMLRENLGGQSVNVGAFYSIEEDFVSGARYNEGSSQPMSYGGSFEPGDWIRLKREGDTVSVYSSTDGNTWVLATSYTMSFSSDVVYLGLAVGSDEDGVLAQAVFDNFSITGEATTNLVVDPKVYEAGITRSYADANLGASQVTSYTYDNLNRLKTVTDPTGNTTENFYDNRGNLTRVVDANGHSTWNVYNNANQLVYTINGEGEVTEFNYDGIGNLHHTRQFFNRLADISGLGNVIDFSTFVEPAEHAEDRRSFTVYDGANRERFTLTASDQDKWVVTENEYNAASDITRTTRFGVELTDSEVAGIETSVLPGMDYLITEDEVSNLASLASAATRDTFYAYDAAGWLRYTVKGTEGGSENIVTENIYDDNGNVETKKEYANYLTGSTYDLAGIQAGITASGTYDRVFDYSFDELNRLAAEYSPQGKFGIDEVDGRQKTKYEYDAFGQLTTKTSGILSTSTDDEASNGRAMENVYDRLGRKRFEINASETLKENTYDVFGNLEYDLAYDVVVGATARNVDSLEALRGEAGLGDGVTRGEHYQYDANNRLVIKTDALFNQEHYAYDAVGNRIWLKNKEASVWRYYYDDANRLEYEVSPSVSVAEIEGGLGANPGGGGGQPANGPAYSSASILDTTGESYWEESRSDQTWNEQNQSWDFSGDEWEFGLGAGEWANGFRPGRLEVDVVIGEGTYELMDIVLINHGDGETWGAQRIYIEENSSYTFDIPCWWDPNLISDSEDDLRELYFYVDGVGVKDISISRIEFFEEYNYPKESIKDVSSQNYWEEDSLVWDGNSNAWSFSATSGEPNSASLNVPNFLANYAQDWRIDLAHYSWNNTSIEIDIETGSEVSNQLKVELVGEDGEILSESVKPVGESSSYTFTLDAENFNWDTNIKHILNLKSINFIELDGSGNPVSNVDSEWKVSRVEIFEERPELIFTEVADDRYWESSELHWDNLEDRWGGSAELARLNVNTLGSVGDWRQGFAQRYLEVDISTGDEIGDEFIVRYYKNGYTWTDKWQKYAVNANSTYTFRLDVWDFVPISSSTQAPPKDLDLEAIEFEIVGATGDDEWHISRIEFVDFAEAPSVPGSEGAGTGEEVSLDTSSDAFWDAQDFLAWDSTNGEWDYTFYNGGNSNLVVTDSGSNSGWQLDYRPVRVEIDIETGITSPGSGNFGIGIYDSNANETQSIIGYLSQTVADASSYTFNIPLEFEGLDLSRIKAGYTTGGNGEEGWKITRVEFFDSDGNPVSPDGTPVVTESNKHLVRKMQYNAFGEVTELTEGLETDPLTDYGTRPDINNGFYTPDIDVALNAEGSRITNYGYDKLGRQVLTENPGYFVEATDGVGGVYAADNSSGGKRQSIDVLYDAFGNAVRSDTRIDGVVYQSEYKVYDIHNRLVYEIDEEGGYTRYQYDNLQRSETVTRFDETSLDEEDKLLFDGPAGEYFTAQEISAHIQNTSGIDSRSITTGYDFMGRKSMVRTDVVDNNFASAQFALENGALSTYSEYANTSYKYNEFGQLVMERRKINETEFADTYYYYDSLGRQYFVVDAERYITQTFYDAFGNVERIIEYANRMNVPMSPGTPPTIHEPESYVGEHNAITTSPRDREYSFEYDVLNQKKKIFDHNGYDEHDSQFERVTDTIYQSTRFSYDRLGNVHSQMDAKGNITSYQYNALGQLIEITSPNSEVAVNGAVDPFKQTVTSLTTTNFSLDKFGNVVKEEYVVTNDAMGGTRTIYHQYDHRGNEVRTTDAEGNITLRTFDTFGRVRSESRGVSVSTIPNLVDSGVPTGNPSYASYNASSNLYWSNQGFMYWDADEEQWGYGPFTNELPEGVAGLYPSLAGNWTQSFRAEELEVVVEAGWNVADLHLVLEAGGQTWESTVQQVGQSGNVTFTIDLTDPIIAEDITRLGFEVSDIRAGSGHVSGDPQFSFEIVSIRFLNASYPSGEIPGPNPEIDLARPGLYDMAYTHDVRREFHYDKTGRQTATIDVFDNASGVETRSGVQQNYNGFGEVVTETQITNADINLTSGLTQTISSYEYDASGRLESSQNSEGITKYYYDLLGNVTRQERVSDDTASPAEKRVTEFYHDALGRVLTQRAPSFDGVEVAFSEQTTTLNPQITQSVDRWGNVIALSDAAGFTTNYKYNSKDQVIEVTLPETDVLGLDQNNIPRMRVEQHYYYDKLGNQIGEEYRDDNDVVLRERQNILDNLGRVVEMIDGTQRSTKYAYDAYGNRIATMDGNGTVFVDTYNANDQITSHNVVRNTALSDKWEDAATSAYNSLTHTLSSDINLVMLNTWVYDQAGRKYAEIDAEGKADLYKYDERGNIVRNKNRGDVVVEYSYNASGLQTSTTRYMDITSSGVPVANSATEVRAFTYSTEDYAFGQAETVTAANGDVFHYFYNAFGQLNYEVLDETLQTINNLSELASSHDTYRHYQYLNNGSLASIGDYVTRGTEGDEGGVDYNRTRTINEFSYDIRGNRVSESYNWDFSKDIYNPEYDEYTNSEVPSVITSESVALRDTYLTFDELNRLQEVRAPRPIGDSSRYELSSLVHHYDAFGNRRLIELDFEAPGSTTVHSRSYWNEYDKEGRVIVENADLIDTNGDNVYDALGVHNIGGSAPSQNNRALIVKYDGAGRRVETEYSKGSRFITQNAPEEPEDEANIFGVEKYSYSDTGLLTAVASSEVQRGDIWSENDIPIPYSLLPSTSYQSGLADLTFNLKEVYFYQNNGFRSTAVKYDGSTTYETSFVYTGDGRVNTQLTKKNSVFDSEITYVYDDGGNVKSYTTDIGSGSQNQVYRYDYTYENTFSGYKNVNIKVSAVSGPSNVISGNTSLSYDHRGNLILSTVRGEQNSVTDKSFYYDVEGQVVTKKEKHSVTGSTTYKTQDYFYSGANLVADIGNDGVNINPAATAYTGGATPGSYTISAGETLASIAMNVFGDSSLWYILANANGLTQGPSEAFSSNDVGRILTIPNASQTVGNNASTFKPFNLADALGDITPSVIALPPPKKSCNPIATIAMAVVGAIIAFYVGPWAFKIFESQFVAGFAAGFAGSVGSQGVGVIAGVQDKIDFGAAVTAGFASGVAYGLTNKLTSAAETAGKSTKLARLVDTLDDAGNVVDSVGVLNGLGQAVVAGSSTLAAAYANGLQGRDTGFSWSALAASTVSGYIQGESNLQPNSALSSSSDFTRGFGESLISGHISLSVNIAFGNVGKQEIGQVAADAFGNALGAGIIGYIRGADTRVKAEGRKHLQDYMDSVDAEIEALARTSAANSEQYNAAAIKNGQMLDAPTQAASARGVADRDQDLATQQSAVEEDVNFNFDSLDYNYAFSLNNDDLGMFGGLAPLPGELVDMFAENAAYQDAVVANAYANYILAENAELESYYFEQEPEVEWYQSVRGRRQVQNAAYFENQRQHPEKVLNAIKNLANVITEPVQQAIDLVHIAGATLYNESYELITGDQSGYYADLMSMTGILAENGGSSNQVTRQAFDANPLGMIANGLNDVGYGAYYGDGQLALSGVTNIGYGSVAFFGVRGIKPTGDMLTGSGLFVPNKVNLGGAASRGEIPQITELRGLFTQNANGPRSLEDMINFVDDRGSFRGNLVDYQVLRPNSILVDHGGGLKVNYTAVPDEIFSKYYGKDFANYNKQVQFFENERLDFNRMFLNENPTVFVRESLLNTDRGASVIFHHEYTEIQGLFNRLNGRTATPPEIRNQIDDLHVEAVSSSDRLLGRMIISEGL